jgi:GT2 family glycosyltransferase
MSDNNTSQTVDFDTPAQRDSCVREIKRLQSASPVGFELPPGGTPFVSVLIATCNRGPIVRQLINQLSIQTYTNYEIVVIDGSDEAQEKAEIPSNTKYLRTPVRDLGIVRNLQILSSSGEVLIFVDDDSYVAEDFIERHVMLHFGNSGKGIAAVQGHFIGAPHDRRGNGIVRKMCTYQPQELTLKTLHTGNCSIKRAPLESIGGFNNCIRFSGEDHELGRRLHKFGHTILNASQVISVHRGAPRGGTRNYSQSAWVVDAGRLADAALAHASIQSPLVGMLALAKYLVQRVFSPPAELSVLWKESLAHFCRNLSQNKERMRVRHLQLLKNQLEKSPERFLLS